MQPFSSSTYEHGVFIVCEGNYGWGESTIFYYDTSVAGKHVSDAYKQANGFTCGNVAESMLLNGNDLYLVVNNSNKIERLDSKSLKRQTLNQGLTSPRYAYLAGNNVLVTDLYSNSISILNSTNLAYVSTVKCKGWTEEMLSVNERILVANRRPSSDFNGLLNEQIIVLNSTNLEVADSIKTGGQGAQELVIASDVEIVTSLERVNPSSTTPAICWVNSSSGHVRVQEVGGPSAQQPFRLQIAGEYLWFLQGGKLCFLPKDGGAVTTLLPFGVQANLTSLKVLWIRNGKARILLANAYDYVKSGDLLDFELDIATAQVHPTDTTKVGIIPGNAYSF